jgi:hypothetical protein
MNTHYRIGDTVRFGGKSYKLKARCLAYTGSWVCPTHGLQSDSMQSKDAPKCPCGKGWWWCTGHTAETPDVQSTDPSVESLRELLF